MNFVLCINYYRNTRRLKLHVVYRATRCDKGWRLVDETGALREYSERYVVPIDLLAEVAARFPPE